MQDFFYLVRFQNSMCKQNTPKTNKMIVAHVLLFSYND